MKSITFFTLLVFFFYISQGQSLKKFKWVPWKNVSPQVKAGLKKVVDFEDKTAYDNIIETLEEKCEIEVAVLDMDGDGKSEYAVGSEGNYCCGSRGCSLTIYKDGGKKQIHLTDEWRDVKPAKTGVISTKGVLIKFQTLK